MKQRCPSCDTELEAFETKCPVCMRERSRDELFCAQDGEDLSVGSAAPRKSGAGGVLTMLVGLGVIGYAFHMYSEKKIYDAKLEAEQKVRTMAQAEKDAQSASPGAAAQGAVEADGAPVKKLAIWTIGGEVYDLISLKPVRGAQLTFTDKSARKSFKSTTDSKGRYSIKVPIITSDGYVIAIKHRKYDGVYLEDMPRPYKQQDKEARYETLDTFRRTAILHVPLLPPEDEGTVRHDLVMLPGP